MSNYVGHDDNHDRLIAAMASGKLHHGWILAGPRGLGKAHFAKQIAANIVDPTGQYQNLITAGTHPDIISISRPPKEPLKEGEEITATTELKRSIAVDQIRGLQTKLTKKPGVGDRRVIIIDAADDMERNAANALLKSLEEPPVGTYFLLVSHAGDRLLPTIRSRCQILRFDRLADGQVKGILKQLLSEVSEEELVSLVAAGEGSPGQALEFAGLDVAELDSAMRSIVASGDRNNKLRTQLGEKLALKAAQQRYEAFLRRAPIFIAKHARGMDISGVEPSILAWQEANILSARAITLSLDKQSVVFQMGSLLASLEPHK
jgi:DNA polymerase III subunit delta'